MTCRDRYDRVHAMKKNKSSKVKGVPGDAVGSCHQCGNVLFPGEGISRKTGEKVTDGKGRKVPETILFCNEECRQDWDKPPVMVNVGKVDWKLLKRQKIALLNHMAQDDKAPACGPPKSLVKAFEGLLALIDHIQDEAAKQLGEKAVFGKRF